VLAEASDEDALGTRLGQAGRFRPLQTANIDSGSSVSIPPSAEGEEEEETDSLEIGRSEALERIGLCQLDRAHPAVVRSQGSDELVLLLEAGDVNVLSPGAVLDGLDAQRREGVLFGREPVRGEAEKGQISKKHSFLSDFEQRWDAHVRASSLHPREL
jgi:hypothetical protein